MGTASMALKTGADIIPMAVEQYGKRFIVSIGENIDSTLWEKEKISELSEYLRDQMATLKWEIIEHNGFQPYESITDELRNNWIDSIFSRANYSYTVQDVYETQYGSRD